MARLPGKVKAGGTGQPTRSGRDTERPDFPGWHARDDIPASGYDHDLATVKAVRDNGGGGGGAVDSVNGQTGVVVLDADDVGALATVATDATLTGDGTVGDPLSVVGGGSTGPIAADTAWVSVNTGVINVGSPIPFDTVGSNNSALTISGNNVIIAQGYKGIIDGFARLRFSSTTDFAVIQWYDVNAAQYIGQSTGLAATGNPGSLNATINGCEAQIDTTSGPATIQLRVLNANAPLTYAGAGGTRCKFIAPGSGGSGGSSLTVTDGTTTVNNVDEIQFTKANSVTDLTGGVVEVNNDGGGGGTGGVAATGSLDAIQTVNPSANDAVLWTDASLIEEGGAVSLASNQITISANTSPGLLQGQIRARFNSSSDSAAIQWWSVTDSAWIGRACTLFPYTTTQNQTTLSQATAVVESRDTPQVFELRYVSISGGIDLQFANGSAFSFIASGSGGGSGGTPGASATGFLNTFYGVTRAVNSAIYLSDTFEDNGSGITLSGTSATGTQITIPQGFKGLLHGSAVVNWASAPTAGRIDYRWYDVTNSTFKGKLARNFCTQNTSLSQSSSPLASVNVDTTSGPVVFELRYVAIQSPVDFEVEGTGFSFISTGSGGGSGTGGPVLDFTTTAEQATIPIPITDTYDWLEVDVSVPQASTASDVRLFVNGLDSDSDYWFQSNDTYNGNSAYRSEGSGPRVGKVDDYTPTSFSVSVKIVADKIIHMQSAGISYPLTEWLVNDSRTIIHRGATQTEIHTLLLALGGAATFPAGTRVIVRNPLATGGTSDGGGTTDGGIPDAPQDGNIYGRQNGAWVVIP